MTYNDPIALNYALEAWNQLNVYFVQPSDAASGSHPTRNKDTKISSTCGGGEYYSSDGFVHSLVLYLNVAIATVAGAVFFVSRVQNFSWGVTQVTLPPDRRNKSNFN